MKMWEVSGLLNKRELALAIYSDDEIKMELKRREEVRAEAARQENLRKVLNWKNVLYVRGTFPSNFNDVAKKASDLGYIFFAFAEGDVIYRPSVKPGFDFETVKGFTVSDIK